MPRPFLVEIIVADLVSYRKVLHDRFSRVCATHEFCEERIIDLQSVTNKSSSLRIDRRVLYYRLRRSSECIALFYGGHWLDHRLGPQPQATEFKIRQWC